MIGELIELTGDPQKVISVADIEAPVHGARFSGVGGSMPEALAEAAALSSQGKLHIPVEKSYTLAEAAAAHADSEAPGALVVTVLDHGRGFDAATQPAGMGLKESICGRVTDSGGTVRIETAPGAGTFLEITMPLTDSLPGDSGRGDQRGRRTGEPPARPRSSRLWHLARRESS